jgi:hypothetical protein
LLDHVHQRGLRLPVRIHTTRGVHLRWVAARPDQLALAT